MKPWISALLITALVPATAARAEWWEARSDHFLVIAEGTEKETKDFAETLERFDGALRVLQNLPTAAPIPDAHKVTVYRFGRKGDIGALAGARGFVAGFYIPRPARSVLFTPAKEDRAPRGVPSYDYTRGEMNAQVVMYHEYTHHFMLRNFSAAYPSWYVEGFAEINSTIALEKDGSFVVGRPASHRYQELFNMTQLPLRRLLDPANRVDTVEEVLSRYSLGWLLIHYLSFSGKRDGQLDSYLLALSKGEKSLATAERIFGDLNKLEGELNRYKTTNLPGLVVRPPNYQPPRITLRMLTPEETATIRERIRLDRGVTRKDARGLEGKLTPLSEAEPRNFTAQILASEAALDAQEFDRAAAAADRALAIKPDSVDALLFRARSLIERKDGEATRFRQARDLLAKAALADPQDPRPLIETYRAWRREGSGIPESGIIALENAFPLASQDQTYRLTLTRQLLEEKKYPMAIQVIAPLAYSYDGSDPKKDVATLVLADIEASKYTEALEKLNKELDKREGLGKDDDD